MRLKSLAFSLTLLLVSCPVLRAHMVYIVPSDDKSEVTVVFSDSLAADSRVDMQKFVESTFHAFSSGSKQSIDLTRGAHSFHGKLPAGSTVVAGKAVYGISPKSEKPTLLVYHPKVVLDRKLDASQPLKDSELEITIQRKGHNVQFRLLAAGKPVAKAEGMFVLPNGEKVKLVTDQNGLTESFHVHGRCAVYLRWDQEKSGQLGDAAYEEIRHYATLVTYL
jgi:hypothetical protein